MRKRKVTPIRLVALLLLVVLAATTLGCEVQTYVGVGYGYPGWGGPCCWGPGMGPVYVGGPVW